MQAVMNCVMLISLMNSLLGFNQTDNSRSEPFLNFTIRHIPNYLKVYSEYKFKKVMSINFRLLYFDFYRAKVSIKLMISLIDTSAIWPR